MHYIFKTFNVGNGDCMTLLLQNGNDELHIMVDCGNFTKEENDYIAQTFGKRIDYLIMIISAFSMCCGYYERIKSGTITPAKFYAKRYHRAWPFFAMMVMISFAMCISVLLTLW